MRAGLLLVAASFGTALGAAMLKPAPFEEPAELEPPSQQQEELEPLSMEVCAKACDGLGCPPGWVTSHKECECVCVRPSAKRRKLHFFAHIPKTGGASFVDDVPRLGGLKACGELHCVAVQLKGAIGAWKAQKNDCNLIACEGNLEANLHKVAELEVNKMLLLRSPRKHVPSQYAHCQQESGQGQLLHHYPPIALAEWLRLADARSDSMYEYCSYDPLNLQTRMLAADEDAEVHADNTKALGEAKGQVDRAFFVGILEQYELSLCLLSKTVNDGKAPKGCDCKYVDRKDRPKTLPKTHDRHGTRTDELNVTDIDFQAIDRLTAVDAELYRHGRDRFERDVRSRGLGCWLHNSNIQPRLSLLAGLSEGQSDVV